MKKILMLLCAAMISSAAISQNAEVVNAYNYMNLKEFDKAKIAIDKAAVDAKTGISAKTWYYRGLIYQEITTSQDANVQAYDKDALDKAVESYIKSIELDEKKKYVDDIKKRIPILQNKYAQEGVDAFKAKDYNTATEYFIKSNNISEKFSNKIDTSLLFNAALAAQNAKNTGKQKEILTRLIELNYPEPEIYRSMANISMVEKDTTKALEYIGLGRTAYPKNNNLMIDELNIYMQRGQSKQMIDKMEQAVTADPTNKTLWFALGSTYDNMGKKAEAEKAYLKAIEIDNKYFDAYYNLGAMYFNNGVDIYNKTNDLPANKQKEYDAGKIKFTAAFNKALPYLEKASELDSTDVNTLTSLMEIYARLENYTKASEVRKKVEALKKKK